MICVPYIELMRYFKKTSVSKTVPFKVHAKATCKGINSIVLKRVQDHGNSDWRSQCSEDHQGKRISRN
ncbi:hypothetical protein AAZX31_04G029400 [Glycine max]